MLRACRKFWKDESGATAIEYALLVAMIGIGIVVAASTLNTQLFELINKVADAIINAA